MCQVKVAYPGYGDVWVEYSDMEKEEKKANGVWVHRGYSEEYSVCMGCVIKIKSYIEGKDKRQGGQMSFEQALSISDIELKMGG